MHFLLVNYCLSLTLLLRIAFSLYSGSVKLFGSDGQKHKLAASFPSGGVSVMSFSQCGNYLVCSGAGSREFVLFGVGNLVSGSESGATPLCVCAVGGVPQQLVLTVSHGKGGKKGTDVVDVLCVLNDPVGGCVTRVNVSNDTATIDGLTNIVGLDSKGTSMMSGCFAATAGSVTLAIGQVSSPRFVTVPYMDTSTGALVGAINLPSGTVKVSEVNDNKSDEMDVAVATSVLGPHENGCSKRPLVADDAVNPAEKRMKSQDGGLDKLTVEERLNGAAAALLKLENMNAESGSVGSKGDGVASTATSDSLVTLVEQALQAGDDGLLEQCLDCSDADVVAETSKRLPTRLVVPLLRRLVAKFEKKPARGVLLTRWIHGLLRCHMSFLLSVPDLAQQLAALSQMLEQRLATYSRLASLAGRLDLLLSQISSSTSASTQEAGKRPAQIYYED